MTGIVASRAGTVRDVALASLAPAVFFAVDPAGWYPFGPTKWLVTATLVLTAAAAAAIAGPWRTSVALDRATLMLVVALAGAAVVGLDPVYAWTGTPERHAGVLFWVLCVLALRVGQSTALHGPVRTGLVVAGVGVGATATAEALGWEPAVFAAGGRLSGLMGSPAYLGAVAALLLPILAGAAIAAGSTRARLAAGAGAGGLLVALIGSGARAAWVGVAAAAVATGWARRASLRSAVHRRPVTAAGLGAAALVVVGAVLMLSPAGSRLVALTDEGAPGGRGRLDEWRVASAVLAEHPFTGVGPEGYRIAFAEGVDRGYEARHGRDPLPDRAHSGPLDVALAGGPVALGAWTVVLALVGRNAWRALRSGGPLHVGLAAGLVAHWVGEVFLFPLAEVEPVAWMLAGVLVASQARPAEQRWTGGRWWSSAVAPALAVGIVVVLVAGGLAVAADRFAGRAATTGSIADAEAAARLRPDVVRYHLLLARLRADGGEGLVSALATVDDALAVSPQDPIARLAKAGHLVDRAIATEVPAHADEAHRYLQEILHDDPLNSEAQELAALLATWSG